MARKPVGHTLNAGEPVPATQVAGAGDAYGQCRRRMRTAPAMHANRARYWLEVKAGIIPGSRYC